MMALLATGALMVVGALVGVSGGVPTGTAFGGADAGASALARRDIPLAYLRAYRTAAQASGIDWAVLAAIGKVECDHGRDSDPSCRREGAVNGAGAGGPMQFLASTWTEYGVDANGDGRADRWDPADAILSAARYLRASGAPHDYGKAIFAYNRASWYVAKVLRWARLYRGSPNEGSSASVVSIEGAASLASQTRTPVRMVGGEQARLLAGDGHLALVPAQVPAVVRAMIVAGNELQLLAYGPGGHPDPRGSTEEDCSSTVSYVLSRSGVRPIAEILRENPIAQDYVHWGADGPGRWVTIYAADSPTPHVFMTIAGIRLDTSHHGTDVGPNRNEDGPRWRLLPTIPTWAHWSVRHPPGL
jgi:hypothetical protein